MPSGTDCVSLSGGPQLHVSTNAIDLGYFQTMGIGMIAGRDFTAIDLPRESSTIVINGTALAKRLWPNTISDWGTGTDRVPSPTSGRW